MTIKQRIDRAERDSLRLLAERRPEDYKALILARLERIRESLKDNPEYAAILDSVGVLPESELAEIRDALRERLIARCEDILAE